MDITTCHASKTFYSVHPAKNHWMMLKGVNQYGESSMYNHDPGYDSSATVEIKQPTNAITNNREVSYLHFVFHKHFRKQVNLQQIKNFAFYKHPISNLLCFKLALHGLSINNLKR